MNFRFISVIVLLSIATLSIPITSTMNVQTQSSIVLAQNNTPSGRYLPGIVYDPINERIMMFGGGTNDDIFDDSWILNTSSGVWTELVLDDSPIPRHSGRMVYDSVDEVIILFGGHNGTNWASDTWVFDCSAEIWTEVTPLHSPPGRGSLAMVYDSINDKVLLFSGYSDDGPVVADTWVYDFSTNTWEEMNPSESPHARYGAGCVFDVVSETMIIFGGNSNGYFSDTWSYDYITDTWTELNPIIHPQALKWSVMTYDSINQKAILFGGDSILNRAVNDTWIYDSATNNWEEKEPSIAPPSREGFGFTYDPVYQKAVLFGGTTSNPVVFDDTWAYDFDTNTWSELMSTGTTTPNGSDSMILFGVLLLGVIALAAVFVYFKRR